VIGERRAVRAFLRCHPLVCGPLEVTLHEREPTTDPRSGRPVAVPPLVVVWAEERPVAVRVRSLVAVSRFPAGSRLVRLLEHEALAAGLAVERALEASLWRLLSQPPRPGVAR
jgi:hypothetical protein